MLSFKLVMLHKEKNKQTKNKKGVLQLKSVILHYQKKRNVVGAFIVKKRKHILMNVSNTFKKSVFMFNQKIVCYFHNSLSVNLAVLKKRSYKNHFITKLSRGKVVFV